MAHSFDPLVAFGILLDYPQAAAKYLPGTVNQHEIHSVKQQ
jgi:hypothetical protein